MVKDYFKGSNKTTFSSPERQSMGILDDYAVRKVEATKEAYIQKAEIDNLSGTNISVNTISGTNIISNKFTGGFFEGTTISGSKLVITTPSSSYGYFNASVLTGESGIALQKQGVVKWYIYSPGSSNQLRFYDTADRMCISGANVGIGTTSPLYPLSVNTSTGLNNITSYFYGDGAGYSRIAVDTPSGEDSAISFMDGGSTKWTIGNDGTDDSFNIDTGAGVFAGGNNKFIIKSDGKVGIGTAPQEMLTIKGSGLGVINAGQLADATTYGAIGFSGALSTTNYSFATNGSRTLINSIADVSIRNNNSVVMTISGSKIGMNTPNPTQLLTISGGNLAIIGTNTYASMPTLYVNTIHDSSGENNQYVVFGGTNSSSSGTKGAIQISDTYTQTGSSSSVDLLINRTNTSLGSGTHHLIKAQVGSQDMFSVSNAGHINISGSLGIPLTAREQISGGFIVGSSRVSDLSVTKVGLSDGVLNRDMPIGVAIANTASGAIVNVATNGMAQVFVENDTTRGDFIQPSSTLSGAGVSSTNPPVPADANHWREIGHALQSVSGGQLCWVTIHLN